MLNSRKFNNYAFFCPVSRLHLTVSNPVGYVNEVTTAILKALRNKTILDVDGVVDIETGTVKAAKKTSSAPETQKPVQEKASEQKNPEPKSENNGETKEVDSDKQAESEKVEEKPAEEKSKKNGKKTATKADAE